MNFGRMLGQPIKEKFLKDDKKFAEAVVTFGRKYIRTK